MGMNMFVEDEQGPEVRNIGIALLRHTFKLEFPSFFEHWDAFVVYLDSP